MVRRSGDSRQGLYLLYGRDVRPVGNEDYADRREVEVDDDQMLCVEHEHAE